MSWSGTVGELSVREYGSEEWNHISDESTQFPCFLLQWLPSYIAHALKKKEKALFKFHDWFNQVIQGREKSLKQIIYHLISPITWYDGTKAVTNSYVHIYIIYSQLSS